MAGQPVTNPLSQTGPTMAPSADGLQFFTPGQAPQASQPGHMGLSQGSISMGQPGMGQQLGPIGGPSQAGSFPPPNYSYDDDVDNEPPLLEELGINVEHIMLRMQGVALFKKLDEEVLRDADLSGPLMICLTLGLALLLAGKLQFGYVYGLAAGGSFGICCLINVMSQKEGIDLYRTMSILGYGLIPIVFLAIFGIIVSLKSSFGSIMAAICIAWATASSSRFFAIAIHMEDQRWLVAYPVGLVYTFFTLITIF